MPPPPPPPAPGEVRPSRAVHPSIIHPGREERAEDAGERQEGAEGGSAGEEERRAAAAVEEEALRPDGGRSHAAAAQTARPPAAPPAPPAPTPGGRRQSQGAALRQHEDGGLRGAEGQVRVLHGGDDRGQGDRLQVPAGRGLERGDHAADGPVQEPPGHPGRQVHPAEAAAAGGADARPQDRPQRPQRGVTRGRSPRGRSTGGQSPGGWSQPRGRSPGGRCTGGRTCRLRCTKSG